jgi:hypothetical protein
VLCKVGGNKGRRRERQRDEIHTKFWSENVKGRAHLEDIEVDRRKLLE